MTHNVMHIPEGSEEGTEMSRERTELLTPTSCARSPTIVLLTKEFSWMEGIIVARREGLVPPTPIAMVAKGLHRLLW
jgi:hypothetical protein